MAYFDDLWNWLSPAVVELRTKAQDEPELTWDGARAFFLDKLSLRDPADQPAVNNIIRRLEGLGDRDRADLLRTEGLDTLAQEEVRSYARTVEAAAARQPAEPVQQADPTPAEPAAYDPDAWANYLRDTKASWAGDEAGWPTFRAEFITGAGATGLTTQAENLILFLDAQTVAERITTLAQYGITVQARPAAAEPAAYDPNAWANYLRDTKAVWAGDEAGWPTFRTEFITGAGATGLTTQAENLILFLDAQTVTERITTLAQYGITVQAPPVEIDPTVDNPGTRLVMQDVLAANPELAGLPEEELLQLIAEVLDEEDLEPIDAAQPQPEEVS
jgi:hypothetical protein